MSELSLSSGRVGTPPSPPSVSRLKGITKNYRHVVTLCTIWEFLNVLRAGSKNKSRICFTHGAVNVTLLLRMALSVEAQEHMFLISQTHILHLFGWQCNKITQSDPSFQFRRLLINISLAHDDVRQKDLSLAPHPSVIIQRQQQKAWELRIGDPVG